MSKRKQDDDIRWFMFLVPFVGLLLHIYFKKNRHQSDRYSQLTTLQVFMLSVVVPILVFLFFLFLALTAVSA